VVLFSHAELDGNSIKLGSYTNIVPQTGIDHYDRLVVEVTITNPTATGAIQYGNFVTYICFGLP
jgi:hypothetical protein